MSRRGSVNGSGCVRWGRMPRKDHPKYSPKINNRRALHDYHIEAKIECGMALQGSEVKSLRQGKATLQDAFATIDEGELVLHKMHIDPYEKATLAWNHDPKRDRKLLVHRRARGLGLGRLLMERAEAEALARRRHVLVLDTATGSPAESIYERLGWQRVGIIPQYALLPDGDYCGSTFFYKLLGAD